MERSRGLPPPLGIQAPRPRPGSREVEPDKAVEHRGDAVVHDRPEAHGGKNLEIRHRHLTGQQEGHGASEQAEEEQAPPNVSRIPASPNSDSSGTVPPCGGTPMGKAKSFIVPAWMNMNAATMRSTLRSCGAEADHFVTMFGAVMGAFPREGRFARRRP